ncbi:MAG: Tfp pilus assembly protein PilE [Candidatus Gallionella acididurans]|uniref:Tfp pilus assembly protein PilE n=1 Tax=Candidatus Gallionella acididurans TaxID=1796491 RepID=A0A139BYI6_9PROT|nr:MAG: Tfp pilus assembly protein PilE [Candidatus Gallionella acididurans]
MRRLSGITLIEILLVMASIGILTAIAVPSYQNYYYQAQVAEAIGDIKSLEVAIAQFQADNVGSLPNSLSDVGAGNKLDPWRHPYQYLVIPLNGPSMSLVRKDKSLHPINSDYDLYSIGKDGKSIAPLTAVVSQDDIIRANNGQFVGLASTF